jgi:hypothetical protein
MIKLNHSYNLNQIVAKMQQANPSKKQTESVCIKKWEQYLTEMSRAIQNGILLAHSNQIENNQLPIDWVSLRNKLKRPDSKLGFYWLNWFQTNFPLVDIKLKGSKIKGRTMVELKFNIELVAISQTAQEAFVTAYTDYLDVFDAYEAGQTDLIDFVPVDRRSLQAYIDANIEAHKTANNVNHKKTLEYNLVYAQSILLCAEFIEIYNGQFALPQIVSESIFGRKYYKGLNLQNCPKIVRHAALGHCFQYDLHASTFAWRLNLVKGIAPEVKWPYTIEYLDEKDQRRKMLADALDISVGTKGKIDIVKELLTAIGFGATASNGASWINDSGFTQYPAINQIIKSTDARNKLLAHPWLKGFMAEQQQIAQTIFNYFKEELKDVECIRSDTVDGKLNRNKTLAYIYQQDERNTIDQLTVNAKQDGTLLLIVHDGFYTSHPQKMVNLKEQLSHINPEADITKEVHSAWSFQDEVPHKEFIRQQELKANNGYIPMEVQSNYRRIEWFEEKQKEFQVDGHYVGNYNEFSYNVEDDPFYMD